MVEITLKQLQEEIQKAIDEGHGDKVVILSNDDEGNGVHRMFYTITSEPETIESFDYDADKYILIG